MADPQSHCTGGVTCPCDNCAAADEAQKLCTREPWCSLAERHDGYCVVLGSPADNELPKWDRDTRDPRNWADRKRHR